MAWTITEGKGDCALIRRNIGTGDKSLSAMAQGLAAMLTGMPIMIRPAEPLPPDDPAPEGKGDWPKWVQDMVDADKKGSDDGANKV